MRTRRLVANAPRMLELEEQVLPDVPPPGQLLVQSRATLISTGTELANWTGITIDRAAMGVDWHDRPYRPGYSLAGVVLAVGAGVTGWRPGDRLSGAGPHASAALLAADRCVPVPNGVSEAAATFGTLGAIALNGVRRASLLLGEGVAVVGLGLIGQLAALLARVDGARPVIGLDMLAARRTLAAALGCAAVVDPNDHTALQAAVAHWTGDRGFDVVIEATGSPQALAPALRLAAPGGRVIALGSTRGVVEQLDLYDAIHRRGVTLIGAHANTHPGHANGANRWTEPANRTLILDLIASGDLPVERLISHRVPFDAAPAMFQLLADRRHEAMGVVLDWTAS